MGRTSRLGSSSRFFPSCQHVPAFQVFLVLTMMATVAGCTDTGGRVAISGAVLFHGTPLQKGTIEFVALDGTSQSGATIVDGVYSMEAANGLCPGTYAVRISAVQDEGTVSAVPPGPESMAPPGRELVPPEYNTNSKLTANVTERGSNRFDFKLE